MSMTIDFDHSQRGCSSARRPAADLDALEAVRIAALGKKGRITGLMKTWARSRRSSARRRRARSTC